MTSLLTPDEEQRFWLLRAQTVKELYGKAYRMCGGNKADAEDALQETYLKALTHWDAVGTMKERQCIGWLVTTLTNEVLQIWRKPYRNQELSALSDMMDTAAPSAWSLTARSEYRRTCQAITLLKGNELQAIALHCIAGYEMPEVAEFLDIRESTARVHLHNGRKKLSAILDAKGGGPDGGVWPDESC